MTGGDTMTLEQGLRTMRPRREPEPPIEVVWSPALDAMRMKTHRPVTFSLLDDHACQLRGSWLAGARGAGMAARQTRER